MAMATRRRCPLSLIYVYPAADSAPALVPAGWFIRSPVHRPVHRPALTGLCHKQLQAVRQLRLFRMSCQSQCWSCWCCAALLFSSPPNPSLFLSLSLSLSLCQCFCILKAISSTFFDYVVFAFLSSTHFFFVFVFGAGDFQ